MRIRGMSVVVAALVGCGGGAKPSTTPSPATVATQPAPAEPSTRQPAAEPADPRPLAPVAPAPLSDAEFEAMMREMSAMYAELGAAADRAAGDCHALADGITVALDAHQPLAQRARQWKGDPDVTRRAAAWMRAHLTELAGPVAKLADATRACLSDPAFMAALQRLRASN